MVQAAVFDAVNAIEGTPAYYVNITASRGASIEAAVDFAAHDVLGHLFPAQQAAFDALLASRLALVADGQAKTDGETVGQEAGDAIKNCLPGGKFDPDKAAEEMKKLARTLTAEEREKVLKALSDK